MKARFAIGLVMLIVVFLAVALPAQAAIFFRTGEGSSSAPYAGGWQDGYYSAAWGMPMAVLVPPTARWQTDYAWGAGGTRISRIDARFQPAASGPESSYRMNNYLPAPPQPSDTRQMGEYYVRGPRR
jgi:hypothetical protein